MGIMSTIDKLRAKSKVSPKAREAAGQFWDHIQAGRVFEVPIALEANDLTMQAVWLLQQLHPDTVRLMRARRSFVLGHPANYRVGEQAAEVLLRGGQFAKPEAFAGDVRQLLQSHVDHLAQQGLDAAEEAHAAQTEAQAKHALTVESEKPAEPSTPAAE